MKKSIIYFIRDGLGHIKIGITDNIQNRLSVLQTSNPMQLEYFYGMAVENKFDALDIEQQLHKMFRKNKCNGGKEWFFEEPVLKFVRNSKIEIGGYEFKGADW